jgi:hypothetical protein
MGRGMAMHAGTLDSTAEWAAAYAAAGARHIVVRLAHPTLAGYNETAGALLGALRRSLS